MTESACLYCEVLILLDQDGEWYHDTGPEVYCDFGGEQYSFKATPTDCGHSRNMNGGCDICNDPCY